MVDDEQKNQPEQQPQMKQEKKTVSEEEFIRKLLEALLGEHPAKPEKILVDGRYVPELDPDSEQFDPEKYAEADREETKNRINSFVYFKREMETILADIDSNSGDVSEQIGPAVMRLLIQHFVRLISSDRTPAVKLENDFLDILKADSSREVLLTMEPSQNAKPAKTKSEPGETYSFDDILRFNNIIKKTHMALLAKEALPQLQSSGTPKYYTSPNTTLANALQAIDGKPEVIGAGPTDLPVMNIGKPGEVTIYVNASLDNMEGIRLTGKPYTEYDRAVHDAVISLFEDRMKHDQLPVMTADMVYRTMTHKTKKEYVSPQQREAVAQSIDKMRKSISVYVDASAEFKRRGIKVNGKPVEKFVRDGFLLPAERLQIKAGGESVDAYLIQGQPLLLDYAKLTGQLITVQGTMLDIREVDENNKVTEISLANSETRIAIKSYLLRRVEIMRNDEQQAAASALRYEKKRKCEKSLPQKSVASFRKYSRTILFSKLFEASGITNKNTKTNSRTYIRQILDYWKATGCINGYELRKHGKTTDAVIIDVQE